MKLNILIAALAVAGLAGCLSPDPAFDIRSPDRPAYSETLSPAEINPFLERGGILVDARLSEDFAKDPVLIPGAIRVDPENASYWLSADKSAPVVVYCVKGKWVSQKQAAYLSSLGFDAYSLEGGLEEYKALTQHPE